jgi:hypothetical protein
MADRQTLGTAGNIEPDLTGFVLNSDNTQRTAIEAEAGLGGDYLDKGGSLTVLVGLGSTVTVGRQIVGKFVELDNLHVLGHRNATHQKGEEE